MANIVIDTLKLMFKTYKASVAGIVILIFLVAISIYTVIAIPYGKAVNMWNSDIWRDNPKNALPSWINIFLSKKLPETIVLDSSQKAYGISKVKIPIGFGGGQLIRIEFSFRYMYDDYPSEIIFYFTSKNYSVSPPSARITLIKPDGVNYTLKEMQLRGYDIYSVSADVNLFNRIIDSVQSKLNATISYPITIEMLLFAKEDETILSPNTVSLSKGVYRVIIEVQTYDASSDVDAKLVVYGKVYGLAGTDDRRRDIMIALLWGAPIALAFGLTASLAIALIQMIIAAISAWYGGIIDAFIQRVTEVFMVIPFLPTILMISFLYRGLNIWQLLLVIIGLSSFGMGVKTARATFLMLKESPYIEAALAYGASSTRIIFLYMVPRLLPTILPSIILSVPDFVFLEAILSMFGVGDPYAPTWGKVLEDAFYSGALYKGYYHQVLLPSAFLVLTSLAFAFIGFTLDKILNPRLREM